MPRITPMRLLRLAEPFDSPDSIFEPTPPGAGRDIERRNLTSRVCGQSGSDARTFLAASRFACTDFEDYFGCCRVSR
jgi:hypothetical protein